MFNHKLSCFVTINYPAYKTTHMNIIAILTLDFNRQTASLDTHSFSNSRYTWRQLLRYVMWNCLLVWYAVNDRQTRNVREWMIFNKNYNTKLYIKRIFLFCMFATATTCIPGKGIWIEFLIFIKLCKNSKCLILCLIRCGYGYSCNEYNYL